jgi:hypothetical protein
MKRHTITATIRHGDYSAKVTVQGDKGESIYSILKTLSRLNTYLANTDWQRGFVEGQLTANAKAQLGWADYELY